MSILLVLVQWWIQEDGGGMGPCLSPGAPVRAYPPEHQPGALLGLGRLTAKGPILASKGPLLLRRDCFDLSGQFDSKKFILHRKAKKFYFLWDLFSFKRS